MVAAAPAAAATLQYKTLSAVALVAVGLAGICLGIRYRPAVVRTVRFFFTETGSAFNLAFCRIVFYATALALANVSLGTAEHFAQLPRGLMVPPAGFSLIAAHFPISVTLVRVAFWLAVVSSIFAALGLFTRVSSLVFLAAVTYFLTIPQLYGKVIHYHTIVWVAAVFAVSRTSDVFSLDAVLRARHSPVTLPARSTAYSRPIRFIWLFLGVSYLGPGLWKYRTAGLDWASASNMRGILYNKWYELGGYQPFVPIDRSAFLLTVGALTTLAFELGFFFLLWHRYTRVLAAAMGLFFHTMNNVTMRIGFFWAMILYVSFVDWERLFRWVALRREPLVFAYDDSCGICRQTVAALARMTLPGSIEFTSGQELAGTGRVPDGIELSTLMADVHVIAPTRTWRGFEAYRKIAWRTPFLWLVLPLLYVPPVGWVATRIYRRVADHRLCHVSGTTVLPIKKTRREPTNRWTVAPTVAGAMVLSLMVTMIAANRTNAWPVALYPTFQGLHRPLFDDLVVDVRANGDATHPVKLQSCFRWMPTDRYAGLVRTTVYRARKGNTQLVRELVSAAARDCRSLGGARTTFSFYDVVVRTNPHHVGAVVNRSLLLRWTASPGRVA